MTQFIVICSFIILTGHFKVETAIDTDVALETIANGQYNVNALMNDIFSQDLVEVIQSKRKHKAEQTKMKQLEQKRKRKSSQMNEKYTE